MKSCTERTIGIGLAAVLSCSLWLAGCGSGGESPVDDRGLSISVTEPVERDFEKIKEDGVLRMITRYSSNTYFLHQGIEWGFEYELVSRFAKEHDLALEIVITGIDESPYDLLNSGEGDIIAANYAATPERQQYVDFTRPYNLVDQVLVYSSDLDNPPQNIEELANSGLSVTVRSNSSYFQRMQDLKEDGIDLSVNLVPNEKDTESLLFDVSQGRYEVTVADDNIFQAASSYMGGLVQGPTIAEQDTIAWAVRNNAPELKKELNDYLEDHFQLREDREPKRSLFLQVLRKRYFEGGRRLANYYSPNPNIKESDGISPYDDLIKSVADSSGIDWLMITSVVAQETKFNPHSKSWAGAIGLMQVMPQYSEVSDTTLLYNEEVNVREGVRILKRHLDHYSYMDSTNQWSFALAAYNVGEGHLADARRLAIDQNKNPNEWESVADALLKLMHRNYYRKARHGFCRGIETVRYVREVKNRYEIYQNILAMRQFEFEEDQSSPGVFGIF